MLSQDLIEEILAWLPVKSILRFRCVCRSWNALISDRGFGKKQLLRASAMDPTGHHHRVMVTYCRRPRDFKSSPELPLVVEDFSIPSLMMLNTNSPTPSLPNLPFDDFNNSYSFLVGSCHGILCLAAHNVNPVLWNPSTGNFKRLPLPNWPDSLNSLRWGFGYDHLGDTYKTVAIFSNIYEKTWYVMVHTLGTHSWRPFQKFPDDNLCLYRGYGIFVNGTLNWLAGPITFASCIVSLDLERETSQQLLLPHHLPPLVTPHTLLRLAVLKGCLCLLCHPLQLDNDHAVVEAWLMKDYGNRESWTKFMTVPARQDDILPFLFEIPLPLWISDQDDQILLLNDDSSLLILYDPKTATQNHHVLRTDPNIAIVTVVYAQSLLSPSF